MPISCSSSKSTPDPDLVAIDHSYLIQLFSMTVPTLALPPDLTHDMLLSAIALTSPPFIYLFLVYTYEFLIYIFSSMVYNSLLFLSLLLKLSQIWSVGSPSNWLPCPCYRSHHLLLLLLTLLLSDMRCSSLICTPILDAVIFLKSPGSFLEENGIKNQDMEICTCAHMHIYIYTNIYTCIWTSTCTHLYSHVYFRSNEFTAIYPISVHVPRVLSCFATFHICMSLLLQWEAWLPHQHIYQVA